MGLLNLLSKVYPSTWVKTNETVISEADASDIQKVFVVSSDYGLSACFLFNNGSEKYIPVWNESSLIEGDDVKFSSIRILTFEKEDSVIYRLDGESK